MNDNKGKINRGNDRSDLRLDEVTLSIQAILKIRQIRFDKFSAINIKIFFIC